jgi:hypothetical protein
MTEMARARKLPAMGTFAALAAAVILAALPVEAAHAPGNLLINGNFETGSGSQPDDWRTEAWVNDPKSFHCDWTAPEAGQPGVVEVDNLKANDARWAQSLSLKPGWYHLSAEIRTENVGTANTGAAIAIMEDGVSSRDIRGTTAWQKVGFYLKIGGMGADVDVALRLGGYSNLNTGKAWFRNASLVAVPAPPTGASPTFDLAAIRKASQPKPIGSPITMILAVLALGAVAVLGWRGFDAAGAAPPWIPPPPPRPDAPAKRRRKSKKGNR